MNRYICVHGHFYQPPRENPWLEVVEQQDAAYPFHDWNERIDAECYAPNTRARVLDGQGRILRLVNNYARLSFNVGPTLLSWMKDKAPQTYAGILEADRRSARRYGGHGSAMAQVYSHAIMPLASDHDRRTQVVWGLKDFQHRFGRDPEGMWLAETAVDDATLELLAEYGIAFVVLSPYQAARTRPLGEASWNDVRGGHVDPTMPYRVHLPSGASIAVFFYDGPISQGVAFEGLLESADRFEARLLEGFADRSGPQLVNIATDGESYGHHHRHGEMALAATLERLAKRDDVTVTNYGQYLELFPPTHEAQVVQASSWSCSHGVERWRADCGCSTGEPGRHQRWREPLRRALTELGDELARLYELEAATLLEDPWAARNDYLDVVLDREGNRPGFLARHATHELDLDEQRQVMSWLELQRHSLLMFTSCGWFFDELSRPEPVQVLRYAARAIQIAERLTDIGDIEERFLETLSEAPSNEPRLVDGRGVYEQQIRPAIADLRTVAAHFAISSLTWNYDETERIGAYEVDRLDEDRHEAGRSVLSVGRLTVRSVITLHTETFDFAVFHFGDHSFTCGVRPVSDGVDPERLRRELVAAFDSADFPTVIHLIGTHLGTRRFSLRTLFLDEQRRVLGTVLGTTLTEVEASYRTIYAERAPLMRYLADLGAMIPAPLTNAAEVVINADLTEELSRSSADPHRVRTLLDEADRFGVELDEGGHAHALSSTIARLAARVTGQLATGDERFVAFSQAHEELVRLIGTLLEVAELVPFEIDLAPAQDVLWRTLRDHRQSLSDRVRQQDPDATRWLDELERAAIAVGVVPPPIDAPGSAPVGPA